MPSLASEATRPVVVERPAPTVGETAGPLFEEAAVGLPMMEDVTEVELVEQYEELPMELPVVEEALTDTMGPGTPGTEALAQAADVVGRLPVVEAPFAPDTSRVDDLKSRIEETRRRIRHELEQPFDTSVREAHRAGLDYGTRSA